MKIKLIQTKESDGNWYKIYTDDTCQSCVKINEGDEDKSLLRATEIFDFLQENKGRSKLIKEVVI
jgi:hypothetical protein